MVAWVNLMTTMPVIMEERTIPKMDWIVTSGQQMTQQSTNTHLRTRVSDLS